MIERAISKALQWLYIIVMYARPSVRKLRRQIERNKRLHPETPTISSPNPEGA